MVLNATVGADTFPRVFLVELLAFGAAYVVPNLPDSINAYGNQLT